MPSEQEWNQAIEWDKKYYAHMFAAEEEWAPWGLEKTEGCYYIDSKGNKILDSMSGLFSVNLGQRHPKVVEAIKKAVDNYGYAWEGIFVTPYRGRAAKLIVEDMMAGDRWPGRALFLNSGSEAVETALMLAKLYTNRPNIITREWAYHGWTEGAAGATRVRRLRNPIISPHKEEIRDVPSFPAGGFYIAAPPFCYRCPLGQPGPDECRKSTRERFQEDQYACVHEMESLIRTIGPDNVAAVITEIIMGAGTIVPPPDYIRQIRKLTRELGILWIDDEVICGFGRTGKWFAYQHWAPEVQPDIMTMGKGIVSSQLPAAGIVMSKEIAKFVEENRWNHVSTYAAHPVAMAAVVANLEAMIEMKLAERSEKMGRYLGDGLKRLMDAHECVGRVDGMGLFWEVELVKNKETREPFIREDRYASFAGDVSHYPVKVVLAKCLEKGVLATGFVPNTLRIAPALTITEADIDKIIEALDYAFKELDKKCTPTKYP